MKFHLSKNYDTKEKIRNKVVHLIYKRSLYLYYVRMPIETCESLCRHVKLQISTKTSELNVCTNQTFLSSQSLDHRLSIGLVTFGPPEPVN